MAQVPKHASPQRLVPPALKSLATAPLPATEGIRYADRVWLSKPGDTTVHWLLEFADTIDCASLVAVLQERLASQPRFAQRLGTNGHGAPVWQRVDSLRVADHVSEQTLEPGATDAAVEAAVAALTQVPLKPDRPLWDATVLQGGPRGTVVVFRLNHAMSDGRGLVETMLRLHDDPKQAARMADGLDVKRRHISQYGPIIDAGSIVHDTFGTMTPLLMGPYETRSAIKRDGTAKQVNVGWAPPWSLATVKHAAHRLGGTVNDFVMAVISGALRRVLLAQGDAADAMTLHSVQIMAMPRKPRQQVGNSVTAINTELPVHCADPLERFNTIKAAMDRVKKSHTPELMRAAQESMVYMPGMLQAALYSRSAEQNSTIVSNVRGVSEPIQIAGHPVVGMRWVGPRFGNIGVQFPVLSYAGDLTVGIDIDAALPVSVEAIKGALADSYDEMLAAAQ